MENNLLAGKVVLITGAARGIGLACAQLCAQAGASVILSGRDLSRLETASQSILQISPQAKLCPMLCDVVSEESVKQMFQRIFKEFKRLDGMVANAGILDDALIGMVTTEQIHHVFGVNTFGVLYCSQYASRLMTRHGGGSIVMMSSIIGTNGNVGQAVYGGSKAAVIGIMKSLAKELAPKAVRVNAITPGFIDTDMARSLTPEKFAERLASIKMNRIGKPEEVAQAALFLLSDMSSYMTGQVLGVDGGMLI